MNIYTNALAGQVAIITGGAQGIGGAAATAMAKAGADVCIIALGQTAIDAKLQELRALGCRAIGFECDVSDYTALKAVVEETVEQLGRIDIVYSNAGVVLQRCSIEDSDPARWKKTMEINMLGGYYISKLCIPYLKQHGGKIFFTGSGRGRRASENLADYSCSKAAQWMLTRCLAEELRSFNIAVNEIIPGPVNTALNQTDDGVAANADLQKGGAELAKEPEDIMGLFMFLATQLNRNGPTAQAYALNRREL